MIRLARVLGLTLVSALGVTSCGVNDTATAKSAVGGAGEVSAADPAAIRPFKINVPQPVLDDLRERLARTRYPDEIEDAGWDYGVNRAYMKDLMEYWRTKFDWRAQERRLNEFDQFKTNIDGLDIHFIHQRSPVPGAKPVLITHGWPGSVFEFVKVIGPLTNPQAQGGKVPQAFHVVAPSIPGFGFSDQPKGRGYDPAKMARIFAKLMERLGYERYGLQGGDYGSALSRQLAIQFPERGIGLHLNLINAAPPAKDPEAGVSAAELARVRERAAYNANERGYSEIQRTKPQTIGFALNDSPVGQAAWIIDKVRWICDRGADPVCTTFTRDEMLADITIYWVTQTAASSARIYFESRVSATGQPDPYIKVPVGAAIFPKEISLPPRKWAEARFNIVRWTEMPRGGHFAALETPDLLVEDMRAFFAGLR